MHSYTTPTISVIIPCYNQAKYLPDALNSLIGQTFTDWEAIIVNDGSTDESEIVSLKYVEKDSRIRYYYQNNSKPSVARNNGISNARGKYILPLDGDDKIAPTYLEKAVTFLEAHSDYVLFYANAEYFGTRSGKWNIPDYTYKDELINNSIPVFSVFRKEDCINVGCFDESMKIGFEDWEFFIRLLYPDKKVYKDPEVLAFYRQSDDGVNRNNDAIERMNSIESGIVKKHIDKYIEYWGNPLAIYRDSFDRRSWMNRKAPRLLFNLLSWVQSIKDVIR